MASVAEAKRFRNSVKRTWDYVVLYRFVRYECRLLGHVGIKHVEIEEMEIKLFIEIDRSMIIINK